MMTRRSLILGMTSAAFALGLLVLPALAAELIGTIKSVDADASKFVVTADAKDVEVTVNDATTWESAKGKAVKNALKRLNPGGQVEVTHEGGVASKVVLKKGAIKKKAAN
jgi:hypothetical protein